MPRGEKRRDPLQNRRGRGRKAVAGPTRPMAPAPQGSYLIAPRAPLQFPAPSFHPPSPRKKPSLAVWEADEAGTEGWRNQKESLPARRSAASASQDSHATQEKETRGRGFGHRRGLTALEGVQRRP